ncbi:MAG: hypothetical protein U1E50_00470 [Caulobacteraceae bacterium]
MPKLNLPIRTAIALCIALPMTAAITLRAFDELESITPHLTAPSADLPSLAGIFLVGVVVAAGAALAGRLCALACHGAGRGDRSGSPPIFTAVFGVSVFGVTGKRAD